MLRFMGKAYVSLFQNADVLDFVVVDTEVEQFLNSLRGLATDKSPTRLSFILLHSNASKEILITSLE